MVIVEECFDVGDEVGVVGGFHDDVVIDAGFHVVMPEEDGVDELGCAEVDLDVLDARIDFDEAAVGAALVAVGELFERAYLWGGGAAGDGFAQGNVFNAFGGKEGFPVFPGDGFEIGGNDIFGGSDEERRGQFEGEGFPTGLRGAGIEVF